VTLMERWRRARGVWRAIEAAKQGGWTYALWRRIRSWQARDWAALVFLAAPVGIFLVIFSSLGAGAFVGQAAILILQWLYWGGTGDESAWPWMIVRLAALGAAATGLLVWRLCRWGARENKRKAREEEIATAIQLRLRAHWGVGGLILGHPTAVSIILEELGRK